jgi:hypothetical protein
MEPLERAVAGELARFGGVPGLAPIVDAWRDAVGPEIARNAWPARLSRDGTLVVHTSSSAWAFELAHLEQRIRAQLSQVALTKLRFVVGPLPEPAAEPADRSRPVANPSAADMEAATSIAAPIDDENLRKVVAKAVALSLANPAADRSLW